MLDIRGLRAKAGNKEILRGIDLHVGAGEVHAIMGPNGSGKSTLAHVLSGRENYEVTGGEVIYRGKDLLAMSPEMRAREGIFLAFQYPVEIPGVSTTYFLKAALNAVRKHKGLEELDAMEFLALIKEKLKLVEMDQVLINRPLNEGFSGGEKKRNEILQMAVLDPVLALLDETDSGLDIDALRVVASGVNALAPTRSCDDRDYSLSALAQLHRARFHPCFVRGANRKIRHERIGAGAREPRVRLAQRRSRRRSVVPLVVLGKNMIASGK